MSKVFKQLGTDPNFPFFSCFVYVHQRSMTFWFKVTELLAWLELTKPIEYYIDPDRIRLWSDFNAENTKDYTFKKIDKFISEVGLYSLALNCKKRTKGQHLVNWLVTEILPELRKDLYIKEKEDVEVELQESRSQVQRLQWKSRRSINLIENLNLRLREAELKCSIVQLRQEQAKIKEARASLREEKAKFVMNQTVSTDFEFHTTHPSSTTLNSSTQSSMEL